MLESSLAAKTNDQEAQALSRPMRILIIDDNELDRQRLIRLCGQAGLSFDATQVEGLADLEGALSQDQFDLIFIDYYLAGDTGLEALEMISAHEQHKKAAAIMLAGEGQLTIAVEAMRQGCSDYMTKAMMNVDTLQKSIATALERQMMSAALSAEIEARQDVENSIIAYSKACTAEMRTVLAGTLRRVRKLRKYQAQQGAEYSVDLSTLETDIDRLWEALPDFQAVPKLDKGKAPYQVARITRH